MKNRSYLPLILLVLVVLMSACQKQTAGDPSSTGEYLYIENKGSDTMVNLALYWAERYQELHPEMRISVTGGGSGTGISSLISNTVDIANASRVIKDSEIKQAEQNGVEPYEIVVARDAIAVIVNPENPVNQLTLEEISAIYSGKIDNWKELGGEDRPIVKLSRETNSGTHVYFLESVIRLGDNEDKTIFSADTLLLPSSEGIIAEVRDNPNAIGYDGLGYITEEVKVIKVANVGSVNYVYPTIETVNSNQYPIARDLYLYTNGEPISFIKEYINWIFSDDGQSIVRDLGFVPVR